MGPTIPRTARRGGEGGGLAGHRRGAIVVRYFIVNLFYFSDRRMYMNDFYAPEVSINLNRFSEI